MDGLPGGGFLEEELLEAGVEGLSGDGDLTEEVARDLYFEEISAEVLTLLPVALRRLREILENDDEKGTVYMAAIREVFDLSNIAENIEGDEKEIRVEIVYE